MQFAIIEYSNAWQLSVFLHGYLRLLLANRQEVKVLRHPTCRQGFKPHKKFNLSSGQHIILGNVELCAPGLESLRVPSIVDIKAEVEFEVGTPVEEEQSIGVAS